MDGKEPHENKQKEIWNNLIQEVQIKKQIKPKRNKRVPRSKKIQISWYMDR